MAEIFGADHKIFDNITVGMVGLGLIGGSMVKATKQHTLHRVLAYDKDPATMKLAADTGYIDGVLTPETLPECSIVMIAIIPDQLVKWVEENAPYFAHDAVLVDLCGVKRYVAERVAPLARQYGFRYVGGHPMAGKEVAGFANAEGNLYRDASMILCPDQDTDKDTLDSLKAFYLSLGFGEIVLTTPEEHDSIISYTSQLAHVASSSYIKSPTSRQRMGFTAGSYKDMTRVARLDPEMWTQLFLDNADHLTAELDELIRNLTDYRNAIADGNAAELCRLLQEGRDLKVTEPIENC